MSEQQRLPVVFVQGLYYKLNPYLSDYKPQYSLYKCVYASESGAVLQRFSEDGQYLGEHYVQHGAKRYILSDEDEGKVRLRYYRDQVKKKEEEFRNIQTKYHSALETLNFAKSCLFAVENEDDNLKKD